MTSLLPGFLLVAALVPVTPAPATAPETVAPVAAAPDDEAVHNALRELKATMSKALNERDLDTLVATSTRTSSSRR